jgi:hypothetical protein
MKSIYTLCAVFVLLLAAVILAPVAGSASGNGEVTFNKDVAPILQKNCMECHRTGESAPMALLTYKQVRPWARSIKERVVTREMPPWHADPQHGEFVNERRLSAKEIETIVAWVDSGAKEGNPKDLPPNPKFPENGWIIGKPDVELPMSVDFDVPADGTVPYKYFAIPTNFTEDKYVQFAEVRRGDPSVIHHVIVSVREPGNGPLPAPGEIPAGSLRQANPEASDPQQNADSTPSDGLMVVWAQGTSPLMLRPGQAKLVKKGSMLILQMHYTTNGKPSKDRSTIGLYFAKAPVEKRVITTGISSRQLIIPPGEANYESRSSFTFKEDSHIMSFMPHMHLRGKDFQYRLVYPDGTSKILLSVPKYEFNWQLSYFLKEPVAAPKGSRVECLAHHDNSTNNKFNPDPKQEVRWGDQTWEEMMIGWMDYTLDRQDLRTQAASK